MGTGNPSSRTRFPRNRLVVRTCGRKTFVDMGFMRAASNLLWTERTTAGISHFTDRVDLCWAGQRRIKSAIFPFGGEMTCLLVSTKFLSIAVPEPKVEGISFFSVSSQLKVTIWRLSTEAKVVGIQNRKPKIVISVFFTMEI